jgi:Cu2+-exporting ATPase
MDYMTHQVHGEATNPHAGHKMSEPHAGHDRHAGHSVAMFRDKFWLSFALTIPVVFWSSDVQHWLGYTAPSFPSSNLIPPVLGTVLFFYGGLVFIRGARNELADRKPGMMTLISLGITVAFFTSLAGTFGLLKIEVWWELATLITIMVLGHWLEMRAISQAQGALNALAALLPDTAERITGAEIETVPLSALRVGDVVLVRPGTRVAADGTVVEGAADVDESVSPASLELCRRSRVRLSSRGQLRVAGAFEFASLPSVSRRLCPASCGLLPLLKPPGRARKPLPIVLPQSSSTWRSRLARSPLPTGGFPGTKNMP